MRAVLLVISLLCLTFFRPVMLLIYPVVVLLLFKGLNLKVDKKVFLVCAGMVVFGLLSMVLEGFFLFNLLLNLYLVSLPFLLITANPVKSQSSQYKGYFNTFLNYFSIVLFVVNISAVFYSLYMLTTSANPEDIFTGLYGGSGFGSHSLSIINLFIATYYFFHKRYGYFTLFFISGILGFYGQGLVIFLLAFGIVMLPFLIRNIGLAIKIAVAGLVFFAVVTVINPGNLTYIQNNTRFFKSILDNYEYEEEMDRIASYRRTIIPRYFTFLDGTRQLYFSDAKVFLLGTSPGTYNSRTAFYLNGDFVGNKQFRKYFNYRTTYHSKYVFPILNREYVEYAPWNDGTRNQPFSSIVSMLLEYGIVFGGLYLILFFGAIYRIRGQLDNKPDRMFVLFTLLYIFFLFLFQYYLEVVEIILPLLLMVKLLQVDHINRPDQLEESVST